MFVDAIELTGKFTRPIHTISRFFNSVDVIPGTASLFFVNADGWAITCKHVTELLVNASTITKRYQDYKDELTKSGKSVVVR